MRYKINEIDESGVGLEVPLGAGWLASECPGVDVGLGPGGLAFRGRLGRAGKDYLLAGGLEGSLVTPCVRCLEPAAVPIDIDLAVTYTDRAGGREDEDRVPFEGNEIDIGPALRDEILLALPQGPLCEPECRGLCPVCGGNRNQAACDCEERQRAATSKLGARARLKLR